MHSERKTERERERERESERGGDGDRDAVLCGLPHQTNLGQTDSESKDTAQESQQRGQPCALRQRAKQAGSSVIALRTLGLQDKTASGATVRDGHL